jgi:hypothetical protein
MNNPSQEQGGRTLKLIKLHIKHLMESLNHEKQGSQVLDIRITYCKAYVSIGEY